MANMFTGGTPFFDENTGSYIDGYDPGPRISSTPSQPTTARTRESLSPPIKIATPDILINSDLDVPVEMLAFLAFEEIAALELIEITRNDIVNGQVVNYRPIKNLSSLAIRYSPQNLIALQNLGNAFFNNFSIKLEQYIPEKGLGPGGATVYIDPQTKDLVVNVIGLAEDERIEFQVLSRGTVFSDTIYTDNEQEES
jgi:hypothetical protein